MDDSFRHQHKIARRAAALAAAVALWFPICSYAFDGALQARTLPFKAGERLLFKARWLVFDAGMVESAVPEVEEENGKRYARFTLHTWTTHTIAAIFRMDDRFESKWDAERRVPAQFTARIRETNTTKDKKIEFDHAAGRALSTLNQNKPEEFPLAADAQDFLGASYIVRSLALEPKKEIEVPVFEDNKNYFAHITVLRKERIAVLDGQVDTVKVVGRLQFEGAFHDSRMLYVWLTDDADHIPVRLSMDFVFGNITLDLVSADGVDLKILKTAEGK